MNFLRKILNIFSSSKKKPLPIINRDGSFETDQNLIDIVNDTFNSGDSIFRTFDDNGNLESEERVKRKR